MAFQEGFHPGFKDGDGGSGGSGDSDGYGVLMVNVVDVVGDDGPVPTCDRTAGEMAEAFLAGRTVMLHYDDPSDMYIMVTALGRNVEVSGDYGFSGSLYATMGSLYATMASDFPSNVSVPK